MDITVNKLLRVIFENGLNFKNDPNNWNILIIPTTQNGAKIINDMWYSREVFI